ESLVRGAAQDAQPVKGICALPEVQHLTLLGREIHLCRDGLKHDAIFSSSPLPLYSATIILQGNHDPIITNRMQNLSNLLARRRATYSVLIGIILLTLPCYIIVAVALPIPPRCQPAQA